MITYATRLDLVDADPRTAIRGALRDWLGRRLQRTVPGASLRQGNQIFPKAIADG